MYIFFKTSSYHSYQTLLIYKKTSSLIYHSVVCLLISALLQPIRAKIDNYTYYTFCIIAINEPNIQNYFDNIVSNNTKMPLKVKFEALIESKLGAVVNLN